MGDRNIRSDPTSATIVYKISRVWLVVGLTATHCSALSLPHAVANVVSRLLLLGWGLASSLGGDCLGVLWILWWVVGPLVGRRNRLRVPGDLDQILCVLVADVLCWGQKSIVSGPLESLCHYPLWRAHACSRDI